MHVVDFDELVTAASDRWNEGALPATLEDLIEAPASMRAALTKLIADPGEVPRIPIADIKFHPPLRTPGKIVGVAMNNSASKDRKLSAPDHPLFFMKPRTCLLGHGEPLEVRSYYGGLHPEPELAVVIGTRGRDLSPEKAMDAVFGYTILNDMTGNDMRGQDMVHYYALYASSTDPTALEQREQHLSYATRYKGTDGFGPLGPWLVTSDDVPDPDDLDVTCTVAGNVIAQDSTRHLTYCVAEVLSFLSHFLTLEPGDIISMGTAFRPKPGERRSLHTANLQVVDGPVEVTIAGLGTLVTPVTRVDMTLPAWRLKEPPSAAAHAGDLADRK
jgi:2-keto-4-pentenoate hydratase/2-oxohepta-3-ene-1,7-dioic acid hydratase in catechol pathway